MALKYAVIGSGAIGGYYGGKLAEANKDVHFLFHSDYDYVKENGLTVDSINGDFKINPIKAYKDTKDMPKVDVVLVCLKTTNNPLLQKLLPPLIHKDTVVILIQNGLGMEEDLQNTFPDLQIIGAMAFICSTKIGDGHIVHFDQGSINLGSFSCKDNNKLETIKNDFNEARVDCNIVEIRPARWQKLLWNIPFNGMAVVLNTTTDKILANTETRDLIKTLMLEVIRGANASSEGKYTLPESLADKMISYTDKLVPYAPSMKVDFDHQRELELEYIYKKPIEIALSGGYEMKCTKMLEEQLNFIQSEYLINKS